MVSHSARTKARPCSPVTEAEPRPPDGSNCNHIHYSRPFFDHEHLRPSAVLRRAFALFGLFLAVSLAPHARSQASSTGVHHIDEAWGGSGFAGGVTRYEPVINESYPDFGGTNYVNAGYDGGTDWASTRDDIIATNGPSGGGYHGASADTDESFSNVVIFSATQNTDVTLSLDATLLVSDNQSGITGDQESTAYSYLTANVLAENGSPLGPAYNLNRTKSVYGYDRYSSYGRIDSFDNTQRDSETGNGTLNRLVFHVPPRCKLSYTLVAHSFVENRTFADTSHRYASASAHVHITAGLLPLPALPDNVGPDDDTPKHCQPQRGLATYDFHTMLASLKIMDTPVGYDPPFGPAVPFTVTYTQRTTSQPADFAFTNLGPKWNMNWLSYIVDDPADTFAVSGLARAGGGRISAEYQDSDSAFFNYRLLGKSTMLLRRSISAGLRYEVVSVDGSKDVYEQSDGSTIAPRRVFLTQRIDPAGNVTKLTYDSSMRITKITDAIGQETVLSYERPEDPLKITKVTDPFGRFALFEYDTSGRLITITDIIGMQSTFTYQGEGDFIDSMTTPYGTTRFTDVQAGSIRRVSATDPDGDTEVIESNSGSTDRIPASDPPAMVPQGMIVSNAQLNQRNSFFWNKLQWKEAANDPASAHIYHWLLNTDLTTMSECLESEKAPLQSRVWYNYPNQANSQVIGLNTDASKIGRVIEGGTQLINRNILPGGRVGSETDPLGRTTNYQYSSDGSDLLNVSQNVSGYAQTWAAFAYNAQHRPTTYTNADSKDTTYGWNSRGQIISATNPKSETTTFEYYEENVAGKQRKGRLAIINGPLAGNDDVVSFDYDYFGNIASVTGPDGYFVRFTYDSLDRRTRIIFPDETYEETIYFRLDPQSTRDRLGRLTTYSYNSLRQLEAITDPALRTISYNWCRCGALTEVIDAMSRITTWERDLAGRAIAKVYTDGSKIKYDYEPLSGRLKSITDKKGQVKTREYNLDNTLARLTYSNTEHPTSDIAFTYDPAYRRVTRMVDGIGTTNYNYVPPGGFGWLGAGNLWYSNGPFANDYTGYSYDELGRQVVYSRNAAQETRALDALGRVLTVVNPLGTFSYTYVGATDRIDTLTYPGGMICNYNYYPIAGDFRIKDVTHTMSNGDLLSKHSYEYDVVGNVHRWTQTLPRAGIQRSWLCGYDDADQLTSVISQDPNTFISQESGQYSYTYDPAGNRLTETIDGSTSTAVYNALNQLTGLTGVNVTGLPQQTYEWDAENRLTAVNYSGTNRRSEFQYDGFGRRARLVEKNGDDITTSVDILFKDIEPFEQRDSTSGSVRERYFEHGMQFLNAGGALTSRLFARDHLRSVRSSILGDNTLADAGDFDPWGKRISAVTSTSSMTPDFAGHSRHIASGLLAAPYRFYDSGTGNWSSPDPSWTAETLPEGPNLYSYVGNNPLGFVDLLGGERVKCEIPVSQEGNLLTRKIRELAAPHQWQQQQAAARYFNGDGKQEDFENLQACDNYDVLQTDTTRRVIDVKTQFEKPAFADERYLIKKVAPKIGKWIGEQN